MSSLFTLRGSSGGSSQRSAASQSTITQQQRIGRSTPKTTVVIVVTPDYEVIVWANQPRCRQSLEDPWRFTLTYYSFHDDKRFTNLDSLLTQLAPLHVAHGVCTEKFDANATSVAGRKKSKKAMDLLKRLQDLMDSRKDLTEDLEEEENNIVNNGQAPAPMTSLVQIHEKFPTTDSSRIDNCMEQLLMDSSEIFYRGDEKLASHPWLRKGLGFYLYTEGFLQGSIPDNLLHSSHIQAGTMNSHLRLDRTAAECIHLLPPANEGLAKVVGGRSHNNSLLGILSQPSMTKMGKRLIERWLRQPLIDLEQILYRQNAVAELVDNGVARDALREEALRNFSGLDISKLVTHLGLYEESAGEAGDGNLSVGPTQKALQSLYDLYLLTSQKMPLVLEQLEGLVCPDGNVPSIPKEEADQSLLQNIFVGLQKAYNELGRSQELVEAVLDLDFAPREFLIKASFKDELNDIKEELGTVEYDIDECHRRMNSMWAETKGLSSDTNHVRLEVVGETETTRVWQFRLPNTNDSKVLMDGPLSQHVQVHRLLKNGVYFSTKDLRELSTKKQELIAEYDRNQKQIVLDAMKVAATYQGPLERTNELIAQLDGLVSLAHVAAYSPHGYCRPTLTDSDEDGAGIRLEQARHPCVELQDDMEFIPNDINMVFGESSFLLLTGPNMGGKSTFCRALGAIVTMAQCGGFVPCSSASINICHHLLCRVGAGDLQDRGISTFMAEMLEASAILRVCSKRSLLIIDELGRGTSTFDGYGLARAISEYIVQEIGCFSVFATHYHELTSLEEKERSVKNYHVTAQKSAEGLTFLYDVKPGPCLESFGIHVAEMANLPAQVIAEAKRKALELENFDYKKKRRIGEGGNQEQPKQHSAEEKSAAMDFISRFRRLPLDKMSSPEEKMEALRGLLSSP